MARKRKQAPSSSLLWTALGLAGLNLLLFGDVLLNGNGRVLSSDRADLYLHFVAWRDFAFSQLKQGHLVLWNPHYLCGAPFFGGFEAALLYPPNWLHLFLPLAFALNLGIALHVFLAGLFTALWARHRGLHPFAAFLSGVIFMFGGAYYLHLYAGHLPNLCTMVWAPLIFLAIDGLLGTLSLGWILLGIFAVSMQVLAGHPQYLYFTAIVAGIYALLNLIGHKAPWKTAWAIAAFYVGAGLVTAIQLWTGVGALLECGRNIPLEYRAAGSFSFPPENLLTLFMPEFFGGLDSGHYWGRWFLWEVSLFIGVCGLFLAVLGLTFKGASKNKWLLVTLLITLVLAFGSYSPLFHFFYQFVPGFNSLRGMCKFDFLTSLLLALLAGIGFDQLIHKPKQFPWATWASSLVFLLMAGLGIWVLGSSGHGPEGLWGRWQTHLHWLKSAVAGMSPADLDQFLLDSGRHSGLSLLVAAATFGLLALFLSLRSHHPKAVYAVGALAILELFVFARSNRPTFELSALQKKFDQLSAVYEKDPGDYRVYGTASASLVTGGYDLWEDEPMVLGRYGRFVCASQGLAENQLFSVLPIFKKFTPLFGLLRLKYVIPSDIPSLEAQPTGFPLAPRMFLVQNFQVVPDARQALDILLKPGFDPSRNVVLEEAPQPLPAPGRVEGKVNWRDITTEQVEVTVEIPKPSLLLVTDNYSSGWRAEGLGDSDQKTYSILPADGFLRAIPLAQGHHHFKMEYRPKAFILGKWVSRLSCILYVCILCAWWKREHRWS